MDLEMLYAVTFIRLRSKLHSGADYCPEKEMTIFLMLLGMILGGEHKIALENPTYKQAYRLFKICHMKCVLSIWMTKGMRVDELRKSDADIAFVMPSHQYPLGIVMPIKRRMELLKWAQEKKRDLL